MELHSEVAIRCLPTAIPEQLDVDIRELDIGQALHVGDLKLPEGIEASGDHKLALLTIAEPRFARGKDKEDDADGAEEDGGEAKPDGGAS